MAAPEMLTAWSNLRTDLQHRIIAHLPFPADRALFRAVCRTWRQSNAGKYCFPWIVFPDCSFSTIGDDDNSGVFFPRMPGVPDNATCLGAAGAGWLALDCTDDVFRRTPLFVNYDYISKTFVEPRPDVKHKHTYMLHNPFSGQTVPLPELDSIVGHVPETFEIRKVLMRSSNPDDIVAVTTSNWNCNVIICRPGKGRCVVPFVRVFDVAFFQDRLYGITPEEELVAFDVAEDDEDGKPKCRRVIRKPLANDDRGEEDTWRWLYDETSSHDDEDNIDSDSVSSSVEEQGLDEDEALNQEEEADSFNGDGMVPDGKNIVQDEEVPYEPKDYIVTSRRLVTSRGDGDLLMVRHQTQTPPFTSCYTRKVEVFKADIDAGMWVPITADTVSEGDALFLSRSFCKSTRAYGDIKEVHIYFMDIDHVFDNRSCVSKPFSLPCRTRIEDSELLTWLFPPELVA